MSFYGDNVNRFFFGQVVNNSDTSKLNLGRVQIRVYGIHEGIESYDLPWAQVMMPTTEPGIGGIGSAPLLAIGAQVFGVFLDGKDSQIPFVLGSVPKIMIPSQSRRNTFSGDTAPPGYVTRSVDRDRQGGSTSIVPRGSLEGSTNAEKVYRFFVNNGFTPEQSAGIVGNFAAESGTNIDPTAYNPDDKGKPAYGIAQWRDTRWTDLQNWASETGQDYTTLETQLGFVLEEFATTERSAAARLKATTSVEEAARVVDRYYERSDGRAREKRVQYALEVYERFK
jgi:hypothetical protein